MSGITEQINKDLIQGMKSRDEVRVGALRLFLAGVHNREIEKKGKGGDSNLTEEEVLEVLRREVKKRKEAMEIYLKGGRPELAEKEEKELKILESYLPAQLGESEVVKIVEEAVRVVNPQNAKDFGKVMGEAMKKLKGAADSGLVSRIIKEKLG